MFPNGIIYTSGSRKKHGEVVLEVPLRLKVAYSFLRGIGAGLIGFAVISVLFLFKPVLEEEIRYVLGRKDETPVVGVQESVARERQKIQEEAKALGLSAYFSLFIPKIEAKSNVFANVDSGNKKEYLFVLQDGVAHAKGTNFPGQGKNIFLFAHSTDSPLNFARYNAVFYLARKLEEGDRITVFFIDKKYVYEVEEKIVTNPKDTSWMTKDYGGERLILQTCDPPGTTWRRLIIVAKPI